VAAPGDWSGGPHAVGTFGLTRCRHGRSARYAALGLRSQCAQLGLPAPAVVAIFYGLTALFSGARPACCRGVLALLGRSGARRRIGRQPQARLCGVCLPLACSAGTSPPGSVVPALAGPAAWTGAMSASGAPPGRFVAAAFLRR